ncbi:hypothetical protein [Haloarcula mannanilytica]|nr:hypothetical protein [Haloarcula mannanilytica]
MDDLDTYQQTPSTNISPYKTHLAYSASMNFISHQYGSWPDMAEIDFSALWTDYPDQNIPDAPTLCAGVAAWEHTRNMDESEIDWQFTADYARIKLRQLYSIKND